MLFYLLSLFFFLSPSPQVVHSLNQEAQTLLRVKLGLSDPDRALSTWTNRSDSPCNNWFGVECDPTTRRVNSVDLSNSNLAGPFPSHLCNLTSLTHLSLSNNFISAALPAAALRRCAALRRLDLSENLLVGPLPAALPRLLPNLLHLDLSGNNFSGDVPPSFAAFPALRRLSLVDNLLDGPLPAFLSNVSTLTQLNLSYNPFRLSELPPEFGNLTNLRVMWLAGCNLVGSVPDSVSQLGNLVDLDLSNNGLTGRIPEAIAGLGSVVQIELYNNSLDGELPGNLANLTKLRRFDVSSNRLVGRIPEGLCELELESLNLYENGFEGELPASIARSRNLVELRLFGNRLRGELPSELGRNSELRMIDVSMNRFSGRIPGGLCEKGALEQLILIYNEFSGEIPASIGECGSLARLRLRNNSLTGEVPRGVWGLPRVYLLELMGNEFTGGISTEIGKASNLSVLLISKNKFSGRIPDEIGSLDAMVEFSAADNRLTGSIPPALVKLVQLGRLDLRRNKLSGEIPSGVRRLRNLNELILSDNDFTGGIPAELGSLPALNYLDLSNNQFSGEIPVELQNLKLNQFNFSNNRLFGQVPPLYDVQVYRDSLLGNPGLCGNLLGTCSTRDESKSWSYLWFLRSIFILAALVLLLGSLWFYLKYRRLKKGDCNNNGLSSKWTLTSFHKLGFSEYDILDCLDEDNVIGSGASGKVYKAVLSNGETVAVKKLKGGIPGKEDGNGVVEKGRVADDDGFEAEVITLGKIRHKNIVKLLCCCTTRDSKLLIYEYMPNGSLADLLHSKKGGLLDWPTRYKIAVDAAEGLSYLHHDCVPPIVHRDVKSNNILLDEEFGAKVADFGVAKAVDQVGQGAKTMSVIAGSCGYIAPEYAYSIRVNEKSDIYSFGVVILELVTGKRPIDPEYGEKDLVKWVSTTLNQKEIDHIIDPNLGSYHKEEICKVLNIGLLCTNLVPTNRPSMRNVVKLLLEAHVENKPKNAKDTKDSKLSSTCHQEGTLDQESMV
ncbi:hypothetical protein Scep_011430 [Stephania cephalantha]|uniref:non-specific serine/threonine protein kinase n=1 Tax=Stephania cephalantha TaxID=152367 RepID=A0AAP0P5J7_9MAGN